MKKKILIVFGTRPEAIKLAPLVKAFLTVSDRFEVRVCATAQHREMLDQVVSFFELKVDYDLNLMAANQSLPDLTSAVLKGVQPVLKDFCPDLVVVQGDTTTSVLVALAAFYEGIQVAHVEAGLRTNNKKAPFPEEVNRQLTSRLADYHFAPTEEARQNLLKENIPDKNIFVTGNTGVDAFLWAVERVRDYSGSFMEIPDQVRDDIASGNKRVLLVTGHRRESLGDGFENICKALKEIAQRQDVLIVYPVHLNPKVQQAVDSQLSGIANLHLIDPLSYPAFVWLMIKSYIILTDSGGIQEEAPYIGKPVLVMRDVTERKEIIENGGAFLVGTNPKLIINKVNQLLDNVKFFDSVSIKGDWYGDGKASQRVVEYFVKLFV